MLKHIQYDVNSFLGGQNTNDSAYQLKNQEIADSSNIDIDEMGHAKKIAGTSKINSDTIGATDYVTTQHEHADSYGVKSQYCIAGTKLYKNVSGTWTELADSLGNLKSLSENKRASIFTWKEKMFVSNGEQPAFSYGPEEFSFLGLFSINKVGNNVDIRDSAYAIVGSFGSSGSGVYEFDNPSAAYVDIVNSVCYIVDTGNNRVIAYDALGNFIMQITGFVSPLDVAVDGTNERIYVLDDNKIKYYDLNGGYLGFWAVTTSFTGSLGASCVTVDIADSYVFVGYDASAGNPGRLERYSLTGTAQVNDSSSPVGTGWAKLVYRGSKLYGVTQVHTSPGVVLYNIKTDLTAGNYNVTVANVTIVNNLDAVNSIVYLSGAKGFASTMTYTDTGSALTSLASYDTNAYLYKVVVCFPTTRIIANMFHDLCTPYSATATASASAGNPSGTYKYKFTYVTDGSLESSGGIESNPVTVASFQVTLTNISKMDFTNDTMNVYGIPNHVTHWNLYRAYSADSGATYTVYKYVTQQLISVATYDDNLANGAEGESIPSVNQIVPSFKYLTVYRDFLIGCGDYNNPSVAYWTNAYDAISNYRNENDWHSSYYYPIGIDDGFVLNGVSSIGQYVVFGKDEQTYGATFNVIKGSFDESLISAYPFLMTEEYGCVSGFTMKHITVGSVNGLAWIDKDKGPVFCNGTNVVQLSANLDSDFQALDKTLMKNSYAVYHSALNEYRFAITPSGTTNSQVWVFNTKIRKYFKPWTMNVCSFGKVETSAGKEEIWYGDFTGFVYKMDSGNNLAGADLSSYFTTPYYHLNWENNEKVFDKLTVNFIRRGSWSFTVQYSVDGGTLTTLGTVDQTGTTNQRSCYTFRLPSLRGKYIAFKFLNVTKDMPFEICGLSINARIRKVNLP